MNRFARIVTPLAMLTCWTLHAAAAPGSPPASQKEERVTSPPRGVVTADEVASRAAALRSLRDAKADDKALDSAFQAMDPWPSTPEQIDALAALALNRPSGDRIANNAALRLGHARWSIPGPARSEIRDQFRDAAAKADDPNRINGMLWALALWGDCDWVWQQSGKKLQDETLKVWVLIHMSDRKAAVNELLAMLDPRPPEDRPGRLAAPQRLRQRPGHDRRPARRRRRCRTADRRPDVPAEDRLRQHVDQRAALAGQLARLRLRQ